MCAQNLTSTLVLTELYQVKIVVDEKDIIIPNEDGTLPEIPEIAEGEPDRIIFNPEHHIFLSDARRIKKMLKLMKKSSFLSK